MSVRKAARPVRAGGDSAGADSDKSAVGMERTIVHPEQPPGHRQSLRMNRAPDALPQVICRIACSRSRRPSIPAGQAPPGFKTVAALTGPVEAIVRPRNVASARTARLGFSQPLPLRGGARILSKGSAYGRSRGSDTGGDPAAGNVPAHGTGYAPRAGWAGCAHLVPASAGAPAGVGASTCASTRAPSCASSRASAHANPARACGSGGKTQAPDAAAPCQGLQARPRHGGHHGAGRRLFHLVHSPTYCLHAADRRPDRLPVRIPEPHQPLRHCRGRCPRRPTAGNACRRVRL